MGIWLVRGSGDGAVLVVAVDGQEVVEVVMRWLVIGSWVGKGKAYAGRLLSIR